MAEENNLIIADMTTDRKSGQVKLQIVPSQPKPTLSHLPNRPAVDLAFSNLTYRVKEGRKNSEYHRFCLCFSFYFFVLCYKLSFTIKWSFLVGQWICTVLFGVIK